MRRSTVLVLATHALLLSLGFASAEETSTTTVRSTTTVLTITTTVTSGASTFPTTQTMMVAGNVSQSTVAATATGIASYTGDAFGAAILNSTNYYRAQHQADALTWDDALASYAQDYAEKCAWQHSDGPYGENLAEGYTNPTFAVDAWAGEEQKYNYRKAKFSESTGHYTQLVWKNTTAVGCGAVECNTSGSNGIKGWMMVCEYSPRGNVVGHFKQEVAKPGESSTDRLGFGGASSNGSGRRLLGALAAIYVLLAMCV
ncbi:hypothetical protein LTR56_018098 [Elasticomyces elasticus]|nr:hypothetical protein LTR56_018098 [Elasticomyces elasticus]KAK3642511.1 hypothetical protein LTR22_016046 [Elasticomyces elasticus]KAK4908856.1 hypothetical protein LTR49_022294 [Elasticomyces elasticus]KAK5748893.1 hypothetical protein LTS12_021063 [Elasticomyces elasticus]